MRYRVFPPPHNGVLRKTKEGVVLADASCLPLRGFGVWEIKESGFSDTEGRYEVARPVMPIAKNDLISVYYDAMSDNWQNSVYRNRIEAAFPGHSCNGLEAMIALSRRVGQHRVNAACCTKQDCTRENFRVSDLYCGTAKKLDAKVHIKYNNGESDMKPLSWVLRHRTRLSSTESITYNATRGTIQIDTVDQAG